MQVPLPLLADYVRLKAITEHTSAAWFIDADTLWLRRIDAQEFMKDDCYGHLFSSMSASPCSVRGDAKSRHHYWRVHFLQKPLDQAFIATPCRFPFKSPVSAALLAWLQKDIIDSFKEQKKVFKGAYNIFMDELHCQVRTWGLLSAIVPTHYFSGVPYYTKHSALQKSEHPAWDAKLLLNTAYGVNAFWQSSRSGKTTEDTQDALQRGSYTNLIDESLWWQLLQKSKQLPTPAGSSNEIAAEALQCSVQILKEYH